MLFEHITGIAIIIDTTGTTTITDTTGVTIIMVIGTGGIITGIEIALPRMSDLCGNSGMTLLFGAMGSGPPARCWVVQG
jgi:hypothetical protein